MWSQTGCGDDSGRLVAKVPRPQAVTQARARRPQAPVCERAGGRQVGRIEGLHPQLREPPSRRAPRTRATVLAGDSSAPRMVSRSTRGRATADQGRPDERLGRHPRVGGQLRVQPGQVGTPPPPAAT